MKKMVTLAMMLAMMFSFSLTANAATSPSATPEKTPGTDLVVSPKTGESDLVVYGLGVMAVVLSSGAVVIRKRAM